MTQSKLHERIDVAAACVSFTCAVHCVLTPILIGAGAVLGVAEILPLSVEIALFVLAVVVCGLSTITGFRIHRQMFPLGFWGLGALLIASAFLFGEHSEGVWHGMVLGTAGALLGAGHLYNRHYLSRA